MAHADQGRVKQGAVVSKPEPPYPAAAKAARVSGTVVVWVVADEEGEVVAAQVLSGHPLLRPSTLKAAREARFKPTLLDDKPIKVLGMITYSFQLR
ncbi:MAG TPA: TonB family protein [Pyrinomonadaceae bacterium]